MTTLEKKIASDNFFKSKVLEVLNMFNGSDFAEARDVLAAVEMLLRKNSVYDSADAQHNITSYIEELQENLN